jgi:hypothetical protein
MRRRLRFASSVALAFPAVTSLPAAALAQDAPAEVAAAPGEAQDGARTYLPAEFVRFAPRTALDMLRQVPGFAVQGASSNERGLGQATGNVVINGKRISGKSNDAVSELSSIPAGNVIRIEIVDGAKLDVPGLSGQVANVVVRADNISGQFSWNPEVRARYTEPNLFNFSSSVSGKAGPVSYTLGLRNDANRGGGGGLTNIFDASGRLIDVRQEVGLFYIDQPKLSASLKYDGPGNSVGNLNLGYNLFHFTHQDRSDRSGPGQVDRKRRFRSTEREHNYEIGGDYQFGLGSGQLKLIGLHSFEHSPFETTAIVYYADERAPTGSRFLQTGDETENIARAEYRWRSGPADWQISAEGAFNSLDYSSELSALNSAGEFVVAPRGIVKGGVDEKRGEVILSHGRPLSSKLSIQLSGGAEYSQLSAVGFTRGFVRPKGSVSAAWKPVDNLSVNAKLQRRVGQLSFFDFLPSVNLGNDQQNVGNPDLVPSQSWDAELEAVRNLGAWGRTTIRGYSRLISDIIDTIPIGPTGESPGNLNRATVYGIEWKSTVNFDPAGWRGAKLDTRFQFQTSSLDDPLTGVPRRISSDTVRLLEANLRHDVPGTPYAWGVSLSHFHRAPSVRLGLFAQQNETPGFGSIFVEHKNVMGLTLRARAGNLFYADDKLFRVFYTGRRTGPIDLVERRTRNIGPIFSFTVSGSL